MQNANSMEEKKRQLNLSLWIKIVLIFTFIILILLCCLIFYIHFNTFDITYKEETVKEFIALQRDSEGFEVAGDKVTLSIPRNVVNTEVKNVLVEESKTSTIKINEVNWEISDDTLYINADYKGYNLPLMFKTQIECNDEAIRLLIQDVRLTRRELRIPIVIENKIKNDLRFIYQGIIINKKDYYNTVYFENMDIDLNDLGIDVLLTVNHETINQEIDYIKNYKSIDLAHYYGRSTEQRFNIALQYIQQEDELSQKQIENIVIDFLNQQVLVKDLLMLGEDEVIISFYQKYSEFVDEDTLEPLLEEKNNRLFEVIKLYSKEIFKGYDVYTFNEKIYINKGKPFSFTRNRVITVKDIIYFYGIDLKAETYEKLSFYYEVQKKKLFIAYELDDANVLLTDSDGVQEIIAMSNYQAGFYYTNTGEVKSGFNDQIYQELMKQLKDYFDTEDVFLRYLKYDNYNAFVVASPKYNYQYIEAFAFSIDQNNQMLTLLESNIKDIDAFSQKFNDFNLQLVLDEIENVELVTLNDNMLEIIVEDMVNRGIVEDEVLSVIYCSYANNYISIKLSNNKEYIYRIFNMRLYDVMEKEEAIKVWDDIPIIILLYQAEDEIA